MIQCSLQDYHFGRYNSAQMCTEEAEWWELDEEDPNVRYPVCTRHKARGFKYIKMSEETM